MSTLRERSPAPPDLRARLDAIEVNATRLFGAPVRSICLLHAATGSDLLGWQAFAQQDDSATWLANEVQPRLEHNGQMRSQADRRQYAAGVRRYVVWRRDLNGGTWRLSHRGQYARPRRTPAAEPYSSLSHPAGPCLLGCGLCAAY